MSAAAGIEEGDCHQILLKLACGQNLVPADREPVETLLETLSNKENPIKSLYELVRKAKGLLPIPQEEVVATTETPTATLTGAAATVAKSFLETIKTQRDNTEEQIHKLEEELTGYDQLISFIEQMFGEEPNTAQIRERIEKEHQGGRQINLSGDEQDGDGVHDTETGTFVSQLSERNQETAEKVMGLVGQGGEWTQKQMYEELDVHQTVMSEIVNALVQDGKLVVVEPRSGPNPASYGSSEFYSKL